jgi:ubiquinone/menaquinone biosynthesis C-methylase UbiE
MAKLTKKENKRYYQEEEDYDWIKATDHFLGLETFLHRRRERIILKAIKKYQKKGRFLDAGCGTGLILRHLPAGSTGVDINPRHLARAKKYAPRAKLFLADIEKLPFGKNRFSNLTVTDVLEHLLEPEEALKELYRVMKAGGVLIATIPGRSLLWQLRFLSSTRPREPYHRYYQESEVKQLFKKSRLEIIFLGRCLWRMEILVVAKKRPG